MMKERKQEDMARRRCDNGVWR